MIEEKKLKIKKKGKNYPEEDILIEKMIRAVMVINTLGKPRLSKFYDFQVPF